MAFRPAFRGLRLRAPANRPAPARLAAPAWGTPLGPFAVPAGAAPGTVIAALPVTGTAPLQISIEGGNIGGIAAIAGGTLVVGTSPAYAAGNAAPLVLLAANAVGQDLRQALLFVTQAGLQAPVLAPQAINVPETSTGGSAVATIAVTGGVPGWAAIAPGSPFDVLCSDGVVELWLRAGQVLNRDVLAQVVRSVTVSNGVGSATADITLTITRTAFDPASYVPGFAAWLSPADAATVTTAVDGSNGTVASQIVAKATGAGIAATFAPPAGSAAAAPFYETGAQRINGRNVLRWPATAGRRLVSTDASLRAIFTSPQGGPRAPFTIAAICKLEALTSTRTIVSANGGGTGGSDDAITLSMSGSKMRGERREGGASVSASQVANADSNVHVVVVTYDGNSLTSYVDTVASAASVAATDSDAIACAEIDLGAGNSTGTPGTFFVGQLGDVVLAGQALTDTAGNNNALTRLLTEMRALAGI